MNFHCWKDLAVRILNCSGVDSGHSEPQVTASLDTSEVLSKPRNKPWISSPVLRLCLILPCYSLRAWFFHISYHLTRRSLSDPYFSCYSSHIQTSCFQDKHLGQKLTSFVVAFPYLLLWASCIFFPLQISAALSWICFPCSWKHFVKNKTKQLMIPYTKIAFYFIITLPS